MLYAKDEDLLVPKDIAFTQQVYTRHELCSEVPSPISMTLMSLKCPSCTVNRQCRLWCKVYRSYITVQNHAHVVHCKCIKWGCIGYTSFLPLCGYILMSQMSTFTAFSLLITQLSHGCHMVVTWLSHGCHMTKETVVIGYLLPTLCTTVEQYLLTQHTPASLLARQGHLLVSFLQQQGAIQDITAVSMLLLGDKSKYSEGGCQLRAFSPTAPETAVINVSSSHIHNFKLYHFNHTHERVPKEAARSPDIPPFLPDCGHYAHHKPQVARQVAQFQSCSLVGQHPWCHNTTPTAPRIPAMLLKLFKSDQSISLLRIRTKTCPAKRI